jgi:hypothetical protein
LEDGVYREPSCLKIFYIIVHPRDFIPTKMNYFFRKSWGGRCNRLGPAVNREKGEGTDQAKLPLSIREKFPQ